MNPDIRIRIFHIIVEKGREKKMSLWISKRKNTAKIRYFCSYFPMKEYLRLFKKIIFLICYFQMKINKFPDLEFDHNIIY